MNNSVSFIALALLLAAAGGCRGTDAPRHDASSPVVLSAAQIRSATDRAIKAILSSSQFQSYIRSSKAAGKVPLMTTAPLRNDTNDPDLDGETVNIRIADALFNAGLVRVSDRNAVRSAAARRNMGDDPDVVAKRASLEAPQLMMSCRISLQEDRLGAKKVISAVLSIQISELKNGENVMRTSVSWEAEKGKSPLGL